MKIVISGKGGSGKSTIISLLARQYAKKKKRVLVVDTDESNTGLHRLLGMDAPMDLMEYFGGKKKMMEKVRIRSGNSSPSLFEDDIHPRDLPPEYISGSEMIQLVSIGKIHSFGEGCACPMGILARQFLKGLTLQEDEIVLTDTEAGIEHFGRGIEEGADLVLMVLDPSYESVLLARTVSRMSEIKSLYYLLNKTSPEVSLQLRDNIESPERIIGEIPLMPAIISAGLGGYVIDDCPPEIEEIMNRLSELNTAS